jgi:hypothetical protein
MDIYSRGVVRSNHRKEAERMAEGGEAGLGTEIAALRAMLREVMADADLDLAGRMNVFCKGADTLARLYRTRRELEPEGPGGALAALDALLANLDPPHAGAGRDESRRYTPPGAPDAGEAAAGG